METSTLFPYFEKGLPLRSRDLNAVFRRADEEVRHTRTCLQGMGILYGLHVTANPANTEFTLNAGAGVTSEGYLYCSHSPVVLKAASRKDHKIVRRQFTTETFGDFLKSPASKDEENNAVAYLELEETGSLIVGNSLKDAWLIILFEVVSEKIQGCANCEKGTRAEVKPKYLLIDDLTWASLSKTFSCTDSQEVRESPDIPPVLLSLPRLDVTDTSVRWDEVTDLVNGYDATLQNNPIQPVIDALKAIFQKLDAVFGLAGETALASFNVPALTPVNAQYVHDYLRLLIRGYNEFVSTPFARHMAALPAETCFPKHLVLGHFDTTGTFEETDRTPLYRPPFDDATDADFDYARSLYDRLIHLLTDQNFDGLEAKTTLRITPSRRAVFPIGQQAIPFYLEAEAIQKSWRPAAKFQEQILSYDNTSRLQFQPFFDTSDFYRIEGHVNQPLTVRDNGKNQVEEQRDGLNLPFNVVVVALGRTQRNIPGFSEFARQHPGLEHQGGAPAGGTFVVVISEDGVNEADDQNRIVGDFCLPYWVQVPVPMPIADFEIDSRKTIQGQGEQFTFINTSKNYDRLEWRVDGGDSLSEEEQFTFTFPISKLLVTHYFVTLTAIKEDRESVEKTTIVVVHVADQTPPPQADFTVDDKDNVVTSDDGNTITVTVLQEMGDEQVFTMALTFENLSENAAEYVWEAETEKRARKSKTKFTHTFSWKKQEIVDQKSHPISLTAKRDDLSSVAKKEVIATFPHID